MGRWVGEWGRCGNCWTYWYEQQRVVFPCSQVTRRPHSFCLLRLKHQPHNRQHSDSLTHFIERREHAHVHTGEGFEHNRLRAPAGDDVLRCRPLTSGPSSCLSWSVLLREAASLSSSSGGVRESVEDADIRDLWSQTWTRVRRLAASSQGEEKLQACAIDPGRDSLPVARACWLFAGRWVGRWRGRWWDWLQAHLRQSVHKTKIK